MRSDGRFPRTEADHRDVLRRMARGAMSLGSLLVVFIGGMAIAHYWFGMPMVDNTPEELRTGFLLIGGGGLFVALIGAMLNWCVRESRRTQFWIMLGLTLVVCFIGISALQAAFPDF